MDVGTYFDIFLRSFDGLCCLGQALLKLLRTMSLLMFWNVAELEENAHGTIRIAAHVFDFRAHPFCNLIVTLLRFARAKRSTHKQHKNRSTGNSHLRYVHVSYLDASSWMDFWPS